MINKNIFQRVKTVFWDNGKLDFPLLGIVILINSIVLVNAIIHNPKIGYDAIYHIYYIQVLSDRLPTEQDTIEFFSPPLPYILPMIIDKACETILDDQPHIPLGKGSYMILSCGMSDGKFAQILNVLLSILTIYFVLLICDFVRPSNRFFKVSTLALISLLTVYYKTFSQVRGEPYVVFFITVSIFLLLKLLDSTPQKKTFVLLGIVLGLLILSRQWGFFLFPAIILMWGWLFFKNRTKATQLMKPIVISFIIAAFVGGWFYLHLYFQHGTITAFNIKNNQSLSFNQILLLTQRMGIKNFKIFKEPIRPNFDDAPVPVFYSDIWGDYWGYFTYIKDESLYGEQGLGNGREIENYLGRVNLLSLIPTLILGAGWLLGALNLLNYKKPLSIEYSSTILFFFVATISIMGFIVFIVNYYLLDNSTVKPSYILQFFLALAFLGAEFLELVRIKFYRFYNPVLIILGLVYLHNIPAFITSYVLFPWKW